MQPSKPILQGEALCFSYSPQPAPPLFDQLWLALLPGVTWVCGDEGSGKTTLLQLLAGGLPMTGELHIEGVRLAPDRPDYQRQVAWFDPHDTALNTLCARQIFAELPARYPRCNSDALQAHIDGLSLAPHLDKALFMLSTGTRRKVLLAAVLAAQAPVTLLDQPFMALDRPSIDYLLQVLAEAARQPGRAWAVADYAAPPGVPLAGVIELGA
ncbi:MAG: ATP-binding cassette domain-containing protein [Polaromonas sp.]